MSFCMFLLDLLFNAIVCGGSNPQSIVGLGQQPNGGTHSVVLLQWEERIQRL